MAVTLNKANLVLKDANGNIGKIEQLSNRDLAKIKTAVSDVALVVNQSNHKPIVATTTKVGVVKPDGRTITVDSNGTLTANANHAITADSATKAIQDKNGAQIDTTYFKSANGTFTGTEYSRDVNNSVLRFNGGNTHDGGAGLMLYGKNANGTQGHFDLVACSEDDASNAKQLIGTPAGVLNWAGKNIVRSVNSVNADDNGNVSITSVNHAINADHATSANSATNATNLGGYPATKYIRSVNSITPDASGNVQLGIFGAITGEIKWFAFNRVPNGYLVCNGASVSRTTYADLFSAIGTTYGSGNGSTTFALPNLIDKFAQGSTTVGTVKSAGLPNITGSTFVSAAPDTIPISAISISGSGCFYSVDKKSVLNLTFNGTREENSAVAFNASRSSSIYGNSSTVQPPALTLLPCIKY